MIAKRSSTEVNGSQQAVRLGVTRLPKDFVLVPSSLHQTNVLHEPISLLGLRHSTFSVLDLLRFGLVACASDTR